MALTEVEMVTFTFSSQHQDKEIVWILATYFNIVWRESLVRGRKLTAAGVRGVMRSKLNIMKQRKVGTVLVNL